MRLQSRAAAVFAAIAVLASCSREPDAVKPTKNVIFMLTDGTSEGALAAARWYQRYMTGDYTFNLNLDPYVCGLVQTHESDCPITCSAPGMSAYMTGVLGRMGNVSIHPEPHPGQDFYPVDPERAWQPAATVLEAARYWKGKSTGLVCTVTFPHATPGAASAHLARRWNYHDIALQQACEGLDLVFGSGRAVLTDEMRGMIAETGATLLEDDVDAFRAFDKGRLWAIFGQDMTDFELDRDPATQPSLSEMTAKALDLLSRSGNRNGFFLMVEGSKVDYGAHSRDPMELITELLEFDRAVKVCMDFAKKDGNTTVVFVPDHGNCGIQIGGGGYDDYETNPVDSVYAGLRNCRSSSWKMVERLQSCREGEIPAVFSEWTGITLRPAELKAIKANMSRTEGDYMKVSDSYNLQSVICDIYLSRSHLNIIGGQHTGEDVFFGVYNPRGQRPSGVIRNVALNEYVCRVLGLPKPLDALTDELYAPHDRVFEGSVCSVAAKTPELGDAGEAPVLTVEGDGGVKLQIPAYHNMVIRTRGGAVDTVRTRAQCVYMPENGKFYVDASLAKLLD